MRMLNTQCIYLCRHGQTEWSKSGQHTSYTDLSLTREGEREALALGKKLKTFKFNKVFISPLKRAMETAKLAHLEGTIDPNLVEWNYGEYEGLTTKQIQQKVPTWNIFTHGAKEGESLEDIKKRADLILEGLKDIEGDICLVSSGHFIRALATRWLGQEISFGRHLALSTASLSVLSFEHQNPSLFSWNDTSHLL